MSFLTAPQKALVDRIATVVDDVEARMMFGAVGVFVDDRQVGILEDETLYLCVDDEHRDDVAAAGAEPYGAAVVETATYLSVPPAVVEDEERLGAWVRRAAAAAT
jgi:TfoX/Sxy family transcriptional regulator of competence genes